MIEWGPQIKALEREQERGREVAALDSRPVVPIHLAFTWNCYSMLDGSRQWGQGFPQPIALHDIQALVNMYQLRLDEVDDLIEAVQYLDGVYLERMAQRAKSTK
jgi:hypothetical protein